MKSKAVDWFILISLLIIIGAMFTNTKGTVGEHPWPRIQLWIDINHDGIYETNLYDLNTHLLPGDYNIEIRLFKQHPAEPTEFGGIHVKVWKGYIENISKYGLIKSVDIGDFSSDDAWVGPPGCSLGEYLSPPIYFRLISSAIEDKLSHFAIPKNPSSVCNSCSP